MYAIIETGGKQYKVQKGDIIDVELLHSAVNSAVEFNQVLLINDGQSTWVGTPKVDQFKVLGEVLDEVRGPKVVAYKYKQRKNYRRKVGHRQDYSRVKILDITKS
ncbi:MAG: 50S ribosomal protein L21 [Chlamydiae bacterium]|nr:50S ribosomal protein L21 [Chlamydiota bacterium]